MRKQERLYLKSIASDIEQFCDESQITSMQELYNSYGTPYEVMNNYFSTIHVDNVVDQLRVSKAIRRAVAVLLLLATIATTAYCIYLLETYVILKRQEVVFEEDIIYEISYQKESLGFIEGVNS